MLQKQQTISHEDATVAAGFVPLDLEVWQAWVHKNRLDERAHLSKWLRRLSVLVPFLAAVGALYYFRG